MIEVAVPVTVEFYDVDPMQVVWHGNYPRFLELARRALFESLGYGYQAMVDSGYAWPIIDMHLRYAKSAVLGQQLLVKAKLLEWENRAVVEYEIQDAASGLRLTRAHTTQVAVDQKTGELSFVCPEAFQARVRKAMA